MSKLGQYVKQESGVSKAQAEPAKDKEQIQVASLDKPDPLQTQTQEPVNLGKPGGGPEKHIPYR